MELKKTLLSSVKELLLQVSSSHTTQDGGVMFTEDQQFFQAQSVHLRVVEWDSQTDFLLQELL